MKKYLTLIVAPLLYTYLTISSAAELESTIDWNAEANNASQQKIPVMVVFSSDECTYCDRLKEDMIIPLMEDGGLQQQVHINEFNIDSGGKVTDFDGDRIRSRIFVDRYQIYATPTVILLDYNGDPLTRPIVGFNNSVEYKIHLSDAIKDAKSALLAVHQY